MRVRDGKPCPPTRRGIEAAIRVRDVVSSSGPRSDDAVGYTFEELNAPTGHAARHTGGLSSVRGPHPGFADATLCSVLVPLLTA